MCCSEIVTILEMLGWFFLSHVLFACWMVHILSETNLSKKIYIPVQESQSFLPSPDVPLHCAKG